MVRCWKESRDRDSGEYVGFFTAARRNILKSREYGFEPDPRTLELIEGMASFGSAPHMRSFNWQCRSAVAASWFLAQ